MGENGSSSLGIISLINAGIALFLMILIVIIESNLVGSLAKFMFGSVYVLIFTPIAILCGMAGTAKDKHKIYSVIGFFLGIFLILHYFLGYTPLFAWLPL